MEWTFFLVFIFLHAQRGESANILAVFPLHSKSHYNMYERLLKALAERGHEVDVVSHFPQKKPIPRYNDLSVEGSVPSFVNNVTFDTVEDTSLAFTLEDIMVFSGYQLCEVLFNTTVLQDLRRSNKKYDLFISEIFGTDCMLGFAHIFNVPIVELTSSVNLPWGGDRIGNPDNPSYIPNYCMPFSTNMSLWERLLNTLTLLYIKFRYQITSMRNSDRAARNFFGPDLPDLEELTQRTSLMLVNSHFSINQARPAVPNFVEVAGLHISEPKPLPKNLENIIQASEEGVIYFSTGSMLLSETFHSEKLQAMFDAFSELSYTVLWKAKRERFPDGLNIPKNVHFEEWMPQLDIMCHPNVKLFVSHGGLLGTQEAIYCGVPTLGIPFFADQFLNVRQSEAMGTAKQLNYEEITKESFLNAIKTLLKPKYKRRVEEISKKFRDRPNTPLETAIFWIEYVIRHKGAPELRSVGADLPWYKYFLIDVISIVILGIGFVILLIYYLLRWLTTIAFNSQRSKRSGKKQKKN